MTILQTLHRILGEMVLPLLTLIVAIWLTVSWKPNGTANPVARFFPMLVDLQVLLGILYYVFLLVGGNQKMLSFPFILHPVFGLIATFVAHRAVKGNGLFPNLGRWSPLASLGILLVLVLANVMLSMTV
ncbi:MAG TPA: hypothetical protein PKK78_13490 [Kouleothrix sp.]|nr:hypothetical protein [Kouleothrix sp.]